MLNEQIDSLRAILSDKDLQHYAGDCFWNLIQMVTFSDPFAGIAAGKNIKELIFHIPTILFWDKMKRYLSGTFSCFDDQAKMTEKFNKDSNKYNDFVKKQIHLINEIDDDKKVDYFASLTRCFLLTAMDETLFFKLSKFLITCTPEELQFIADIDFEYCGKNSAIISSLYQYGLFTQAEDQSGAIYILSDFGKALKQNSLNFDTDLSHIKRIVSYEEITPLNIAEPMTKEDMDTILTGSEIVHNCDFSNC